MEITCRLNPAADQPLYEQLYRHIAGEIGRGRIPRDARLPSRRALSRHLRVSESTISAAYELLQDEGYIRPESKRGFFVNAVQPLPEVTASIYPGPQPASAPVPRFDFSTSATDASLFPQRVWMRLMRETLHNRPDLLQRGDPQGDWALRTALSDFLYQYRALRAGPERVVIGAGADYLLSVLLQLLPEGSVVAAEDPGYHGLYRACGRQRLSVLPLAVDEAGMSSDLLRRSTANVCYVMPSHQFPLGLSMPAGRRSELLRWAGERPGRLIIEDDYDSEFRHQSRPLPALQGMTGDAPVAYIGTFSRSLAPSMRLAYMVLPDALLERHRQGLYKTGETVSRFEQHTLARFIAQGHYARHLRRAGNAYAARLARLLALLRAIPHADISGEQAGLHFLLTVPQLSEQALTQRAAAAGIPLRGLSEYCMRAKPKPSTVVMGFAGLRDDQLDEAVAALRTAWGV